MREGERLPLDWIATRLLLNIAMRRRTLLLRHLDYLSSTFLSTQILNQNLINVSCTIFQFGHSDRSNTASP